MRCAPASSDAADDPAISPVASKRLKEMLAFTETVDRWYTQMLNVPRPQLIALIRLGEKIVSFLPGKIKIGGERAGACAWR